MEINKFILDHDNVLAIDLKKDNYAKLLLIQYIRIIKKTYLNN